MFDRDEYGYWFKCESCGHFQRVVRAQATGDKRVWCESCGEECMD